MAGKWVLQLFKSKIAQNGGLVRRKLSSIDKYASRQELRDECLKRGFHIVQNGDQWIVLCNKAQVQIIQ